MYYQSQIHYIFYNHSRYKSISLFHLKRLAISLKYYTRRFLILRNVIPKVTFKKNLLEIVVND